MILEGPNSGETGDIIARWNDKGVWWYRLDVASRVCQESEWQRGIYSTAYFAYPEYAVQRKEEENDVN